MSGPRKTDEFMAGKKLDMLANAIVISCKTPPLYLLLSQLCMNPTHALNFSYQLSWLIQPLQSFKVSLRSKSSQVKPMVSQRQGFIVHSSFHYCFHWEYPLLSIILFCFSFSEILLIYLKERAKDREYKWG